MFQKIWDFIKGIFSNDIDLKMNNINNKKSIKNKVKNNKKCEIKINNNIGDNNGK